MCLSALVMAVSEEVSVCCTGRMVLDGKLRDEDW